jgi:pseudouridine-5'-phosphate glycosidase
MSASGSGERFLDFKKEVKAALEQDRPVVALESTIIAHGMPYPENLEVAREVEKIIREYGVVPATIAVIKGKIKIGLSGEEMEFLATSKEVIKASRRDLSIIIAKKLTASTTVAATMVAAHLAGIRVFVTGGIGGAHRGAEKTFDVSADLQELARTPVAVVCAGAKAILDLSLTLEYLETMGVPVVGFKTDELPAFYCRESGLKVDYVVNDEVEAAKVIRTKWDLGLASGILIARIINKAVLEAAKKGIKGKGLTPYLLGRINELSEGKCLEANIALIKNNARVGAKIARALLK